MQTPYTPPIGEKRREQGKINNNGKLNKKIFTLVHSFFEKVYFLYQLRYSVKRIQKHIVILRFYQLQQVTNKRNNTIFCIGFFVKNF